MATKLMLLLLATALDVNSSYTLNTSRWCEGFNNTSEKKFHLYCPDLDGNVRIVRNNKNFFIECETPAKFNFTVFPKLRMTETRDVKFTNCTMPEENTIFGPLLRHFGIMKMKTFTANNLGRSLQPLTFSKGFEWLKYLTLSRNGIRQLDENIFQALKNLTRLNLRDNIISNLTENVFHSLENLKTLDLDKNKISFLPRYIFANLVVLETLKLSHNKLTSLEEGLFTHQKQLCELDLAYNEISDLPRNLFVHQDKLETLLISNNKLQTLKIGIFTHQNNLSELDLVNNEISFLPNLIFFSLSKLKTLKLSNNKLNVLVEGIFKNQNQLEFLYLDRNKLDSLTKDMFAGLNFLTTLRLTNNNFKTIATDAFHNIPRLEDIEFGNIDIKYAIPDNIFANNTDIMWLYLERVRISKGFVLPSTVLADVQFEDCELEYISGKGAANNSASSEKMFANQTRLDSLSLSNNKFFDLPDGMFDGLNNLTYLSLSFNNLSIISGYYLRELHELVEISLNHNHIQLIASNAFINTQHLEKIDLSYNRLQYFDDNNSPFICLEKLSRLNLSNNRLTTIPPGMQIMKNLNFLDLGSNKIEFIKYGEVPNSNCAIYNSVYKPVEEVIGNDLIIPFKFLKIFLNDNPLTCDCSMYHFLLREEESVKNAIVTHLSRICTETASRCGETMQLISIKCPNKCNCPMNSVGNIEIDCSHRKLQNCSSIKYSNSHSVELYINNNYLTELPNLQSNKNVTIIQASHNHIEYIKLENLSPGLRFLGVSHNKIKSISADVVQVLHNNNNLEIIFFANNPWQCDCSKDSNELIAFFMRNMSMTDLQDTKCRLPSGVDYEFSSEVIKDVCSKQQMVVISVILTILSLIIGILGTLFYKYKQFLIVWLYAHNIRLWFMDDDDFDKDKKFDAFLSYSYLEDDLAIKIVTELETGNPPLKLCVHVRDFIPGRLIKESIAECMDNSCRIIVILSKDYLKSRWGLKEFSRGYEIGLAEKRMRLIAVISGDIGDSEQLPPTIKSYLKTHTYIKWGDPWFWEKMRYAMPHRTSKK